MLFFTFLYFSDPSKSIFFFLSQFSPFALQIKNIFSDPGFLLLRMFAKDVTGCSSHCFVEGGDHRIHFCICIIHNGERCKPPTYYCWESFQQVGSFSFSRSNLSPVCFDLLIFFVRRRWKVIISRSWSLPMSTHGKRRVLAMFTPDRKRFLAKM